MPIILNGKTEDIADGSSLLALLKQKDVSCDQIVTEINGTIVKRGDYGTTAIRNGDSVEIVRFVGGG
jgi:sulfur carrier protein